MQQRSGCGRALNRVRPLATLLAEARAQAAREGRALLYPSGFVFHESRVGSTLTANILAAVPTHLVYSEGFRMPCASCEPAAKLRALRDYVALMGNSASHTRLFIKFQSAMTTLMPLIAKAFPDVPWLFIFREPVQVHRRGRECARARERERDRRKRDVLLARTAHPSAERSSSLLALTRAAPRLSAR